MPIRPAVNLWPVRSLVDPTFYTGSRHLATLAVENPSALPWVYDVELTSAAFVAGSHRWPDVSIGAGQVEVLYIWFDMIDQVGEYPVSAVVSEVTTGTTFPQFWFENITLESEPIPQFYLVHYEPWSIDMVGDLPWDIDPSADLLWTLDTIDFISAPSSLQMQTFGQYRMRGALCTVPSAMNLPEGRVVTSFMRQNPYALPHVMFRNQSPTYPEIGYYGSQGRLGFKNTYDLYIYTSGVALVKFIDSTYNGLGSWKMPTENLKWYSTRFTWWKFGTSLVVRCEFWDGSQWVPVLPDIFDHDPSFEGSTINRVGVGYGRPNYGGKIWIEDTVIWGRD